MEIDTFESRLRSIISDPTTLRPFVCEGSPLDCEAFLIGLNAATKMKPNWWDFWEQGKGFNKDKWDQHYRAERCSQKTKTDRAKKGLSKTRERIDRVVAGALEGAPLRCLETNVFSLPSATIAELSGEQRNTDVFEFLVNAIRPKIVLAYGGDALTILGSNRPFKVVPEDHLRSIRYADAEALGRRLNTLWRTL